MIRDVLDRAALLREEGRPFALATVTWRRAPSSGRVGGRAIIHPDGSVEGWVGGACAEPTLVREALQALAEGHPRLVVLGVSDDREGIIQVPMACSSEGALEVFVEPMLPSPHLHVVGRSPMTDTLVQLAASLGWRTSRVTDSSMEGVGGRSFVVIATQGHNDEPAIAAALETAAAYIGLVASEKRAGTVLAWLRDSGVSDEALTRLRAPAGLDLGPTEHEEMAVAILAELVALRSESGVAKRMEIQMPEQAIDPICNMTVDPATASWSSEHQGEMYYFCAPGCKKVFDNDPESFLAGR